MVSAEGINSQDGTAESLQYIPVLFEVVCAEGINSAGDSQCLRAPTNTPCFLHPSNQDVDSFGRMWMLGSRLIFSAKRKLQFFEPGCSSESLSSGEAIEK